MTEKTKRTVLVIALIVLYVAVDIAMDVLLFPTLPDALQEHHKDVVSSSALFFGLVPVWIIGILFFEHRGNRMGVILFGSALAATAVFAFTSLPFIWIAATIPASAPAFLLLHDHGLWVYFIVLVAVFGYRCTAGRLES